MLTHTSRAGTSAALPAARRVAVEACAEQPEAQAGLVLDAEIIARRRRPRSLHHSPAMRSGLRRRHLVQGAPPAEAQRRAVGHFARPPRSARAWRAAAAAAGSIRRRRGSGAMRPSRLGPSRSLAPARAARGELRDMAVVRRRGASTRRRPSRALSAVDQAVELGRDRSPSAETDLLVRARLRRPAPRAAPDRSRSRDRARRRARPAARRTARGSPRRRASAATVPAAMRLHRAVGAEQRELEPARAVAARARARVSSRAASRSTVREHVLLARDRLGEALLGHIGRDRQARA